MNTERWMRKKKIRNKRNVSVREKSLESVQGEVDGEGFRKAKPNIKICTVHWYNNNT